ncbi:maleylpyruvate isomerase family mycothiol-dependent enzyme [Streptomyces sp. B93]|uniref:maleylpyruvate isomerase family mycothiol-dependent enzyme n=1 Tax=Streptomyces sp. B93 TaxID=2824875 RepID=UPI001B399261|nr:maleylpyruvate isomerase family mycothiol-dependent enzyme [Streptomyces sp. B93]MBQ1093402.1 maleylpyruvate isomerase N-terminal domain-containing protein [Streptomyces sp. B93]
MSEDVMAPSPTDGAGSLQVWLEALHTSSRRLADTVASLSERELKQPSMAAGWSIAQVLSHVGSAAEISTGLLERGIAGDERGPVREDLEPVWQRWNTLPPLAQREAWQEADTRHLQLLGSLDMSQQMRVRVPYFAGLLNLPAYAGYRLSEHSVHAWDIEAALTPGATIPVGEVDLLWERLDLVATRFRDATTLARLAPAQLTIALTSPARTVLLDLGAELHLYPCEPAEPAGSVTGAAEAVLRLVYGRHQPTDEVQVSGAVTLTDLTALFPGF